MLINMNITQDLEDVNDDEVEYREVIEKKLKDRGVLIDPTSKRSSVWEDFMIWYKDPYTANCIYCHSVVDDEN